VVGQRLSVDAGRVDAVPFFIGVADPDSGMAVACGPGDCLAVFGDGSALIPRSGESSELASTLRSSRSVVISVPDGYAGVITLGKLYQVSGGFGLDSFDAHAFVEFTHSEPEPGNPLLFTAHTSQSFEQASASLASNGSSLVLAALDIQTGLSRELFVAPVPSDKRQLRVSSNRTAITPEMIDGFPAMIRDPQILWNGRRFLLVFHQSDQVLYPGRDARVATKGEITGLWIEPDGSVLSDELFELTSDEGVEWQPSLAVDSRGLMALAYVQSPGGEFAPTTRLFVKILSDGAQRSRPVRRPGSN
jgi:hypothetical protein